MVGEATTAAVSEDYTAHCLNKKKLKAVAMFSIIRAKPNAPDSLHQRMDSTMDSLSGADAAE